MRALIASLFLFSAVTFAAPFECTQQGVKDTFEDTIKQGEQLKREGELLLELQSGSTLTSGAQLLVFTVEFPEVDYEQAIKRYEEKQIKWFDLITDVARWAENCKYAKQQQLQVMQYTVRLQELIDDMYMIHTKQGNVL